MKARLFAYLAYLIGYHVVLVLFLTSCFKKEPATESSEKISSALILDQPTQSLPKTQLGFLNKEQREAIYFAASLEREALKLITKNKSYDRATLFSILSAIFENDAGAKKMFPTSTECTRIRIEKKVSTLFLYKTCQKPETLIAEVNLTLAGQSSEIEFKAKEWSSVIGTSVALTSSDVRCQLLLKNKKLQSMNCQNWSYLVSEDHLSATEIKLKTFSFDRDNAAQFQLKGGFFKDLVENKKIAIVIPIEGQIKMIEKELEVIDDFAEKPAESVPAKTLKPITLGGPHGQSKEADKEADEKNSEKNAEENNQEGRQEEGSEKSNEKNNEKTREEIERENQQNTESGPESGGVPRNGIPETPNRGR